MFETVSAPEDLGISSQKLLDFIDAAKKAGVDFHSLLLMRHGKIACKMEWAPYHANEAQTLFSLSKSFCAAAVGFAVSEGYFSLNDKILPFFPESAPANPSERLEKITVSDLLCMGSGLSKASDNHTEDPDWAKFVLAQETEFEPGTHFCYNSHGTFLLSCIVQKTTGQTCRDFLYPRLFKPLKIKKPQWDCSPLGFNCGGWGIHLSCESIAKFAQLLLQDGMWEGKRILPEGFTALYSQKHIENFAGDEQSDWQQGYGYQFWRCREGRWRGDGMYGQVCMIDQKNDVALAVTCGVNDMHLEFDLLHDHLLSAIDAAPADTKTQKALARRLKTLAYPFPTDDGTAPLTGTYTSADGKTTLAIKKRRDLLDVTLTGECDRFHAFPPFHALFGRETPHEGRLCTGTDGEGAQKYIASYGTKGNTTSLTLRLPNGPESVLLTLTKKHSAITLTARGAGMQDITNEVMQAHKR